MKTRTAIAVAAAVAACAAFGAAPAAQPKKPKAAPAKAPAEYVPRSFAQEVERYLAVHPVEEVRDYGDFCRLVAQPAAGGDVDATVRPCHKARKIRFWGAFEHLAMMKKWGLDVGELDFDAAISGNCPDVVFVHMEPGYSQGDVDAMLEIARRGAHVVVLQCTDRWGKELAKRLGYTYGGVMTAPQKNRGGVFIANCPKLFEGFPKGRLDAPLLDFFGASRHGLHLTGDRCLMGVADTDRCRIATAIAQYAYGKGAFTLVGPCVDPSSPAMQNKIYKRLLLNLIDLMPPAADEKPCDVILYTRWKWRRDKASGAVVPRGSFHHFSTETGAGEMSRYFSAKGLAVKVTDDPDVFLSPAFARCRSVVFACANEEQFENKAQREAFYAWAKAGGGTLVIHSASNCDIGSAAWRDFLGGTFLFHYPKHMPVPFAGECDRSHPAIACLPEDYVWADDEIYVNDMVPGAVKPVLTFRADTLPQNMKDWIAKRGVKADKGRHILEWTKDYGKGRVYYTALGHNAQDFSKPEFLEHLYQAAMWSCRLSEKGGKR